MKNQSIKYLYLLFSPILGVFFTKGVSTSFWICFSKELIEESIYFLIVILSMMSFFVILNYLQQKETK